MGPVLNGLIKLQSVENRLRIEKAKLTRDRRNVIIQESQIKNLQNTLKNKKDEILLCKVQFDRLQLKLTNRDVSIAKLRKALNSAKTNKEYAAVLTQLNTTKTDSSKIEIQSLELLKIIEADEIECWEIKHNIDEQKQHLKQLTKETEMLISKRQAEIDKIQAEWDQIAQTIHEKTLEIFKRVSEKYNGQVIAVVEQQEQEDESEAYSCGGCFMGITAESFNLLRTKDYIIRCPNCTRILVVTNANVKDQ